MGAFGTGCMNIRDIRHTTAICTLLVVFLGVSPARAQISPGKLSRPHAHLEGLTKCGNCHKLGDREVGPKCLDCHKEIAAMRDGGQGLHAGSDYATCVDCHVEHQGEDYDLVYWPTGIDGFDHRDAGFALDGRHAEQDCRKCHNAKYVVDPAELKGQGKDLGRTYLGLDGACTACHEDVHAGAFADRAEGCVSCHTTAAWKPATGFDHAVTAYPLTGKHVAVACDACHRQDGPETAAVYKGLAFAACTDCHTDPHANALGPDCASCHTTAGWKQIAGEGFDHAKTRYPLEGRHAVVTCAQCHGQRGAKPAFAHCLDCHADVHDGGSRGRPVWLACEGCHTVEGFRPAQYPLETHQAGGFPLVGAHVATPCNECHRPTGTGAYPTAPDLAPPHGTCVDCHRDPHMFHDAARGAAAGCTSCHGNDAWRPVTYDHGATRFALDGRHAAIDCVKCHLPTGEDLVFTGLKSSCAGCHDDVHASQFAAEGDAADCARCHVTVDWFAEKFDHDRDSRFPLRGGHERVACTTCHQPLPVEEGRSLRFKPLPVDCRACHTNEPSTKGPSR